MLRSAQGVVVDAAMLSDPGRDPEKQVNEDAIAFAETSFGIAAIVCDGMGGHERGELASRTAIERMLEVLRSGGQPLERLLSTAVERAHAEVYALGGNAPVDARPGSTAVIVALAGREGLVAHVGDSRAYRIRARHLERLTRDHSVVEALLAAGAISPDQANLHPDANRITRALGIAPEIEPELSPPIHVEAGDAFVLCTDGLSDLVNDLEITEIVSGSPSPEAACESLVTLANQRGGHDNISVHVLRVLALGPPRRGETVGLAPTSEPRSPKAATQSNAPNTAPSPTLDASPRAPGVLPKTLESTAKSDVADAQTVVANPGFTVVMGVSEPVPKTVHQPVDPKNAAPTVLDPAAVVRAPHKTLPGDDLPPPTPPNAHAPGLHHALPDAGSRPTAPFDPLGPLVKPSAAPIPHPNRSPREGEVRVLLWATVIACGLIFALIVVWSLLR